MKIGIDIMGGDFAPQQILQGAILAKKELGAEDSLFLFGPEKEISDGLTEAGENLNDYIIVDCSQTIEMGDDPVKSFLEKTDSGMVKGFVYLSKGIIDGFASAGNTGAMLVGATKVIGLVEGIIRPCISSYYPNSEGKNNLIMDVGINADAKPENLVQYATLGDLYARNIMGIDNPKIALLNIGEEESKGNANAKATYQLLKNVNSINFIGNVEGGDLYKAGVVDVIITDGFTGNVVLKQAESFYQIVKERNISDNYFDNYN
ncbi:MAG: phosphate--acyl-ACP acyltransferase, partial [Bacteroidales bacterium]|nr:phosphate--acyl-ACP acyltransferase [Bacteroidales bacterium]